MLFLFGDCSLDTDTYEIRQGGQHVPVEPQVFDLLALLIANRERVVSKDEIVGTVWRGRAVSDAAISSRVMAARRVLGDDGSTQSLIATVRRRGFRFIGDVREERRDAPARTDGNGSSGPGRGDPSAGARSTEVPEALRMPAGPRIAVQRFESLSESPLADFFCRAIAEEITAALIRFSELRVSARSVFARLEAEALSPPEIGARIEVEYLVQGSVQLSEDRARVIARLLRAGDGRLLWVETYDAPLAATDLFDVQDDIVGNVVASIGSVSSGVIARETVRRPHGEALPSLTAYKATVRASEIMTSGFSAASHLATREALEEVVVAEPGYASAWAMLAWTHSIEHTEGHNRVPGSRPLDRALDAARRAVDLAPDNPIAHFAMARAAYIARDLELFRHEALVALRLNPHDPFLLGCLGNWLAFSGNWEQGTAFVRKAIALNPRHYPRWWHAALGKNHYRKKKYRDALVEFKNINLPNWWWNQVELAYTYGHLGEKEKACAAVDALQLLYPGFDINAAVREHEKFNFEPSYIGHAINGLVKAGVPGRSRQYKL